MGDSLRLKFSYWEFNEQGQARTSWVVYTVPADCGELELHPPNPSFDLMDPPIVVLCRKGGDPMRLDWIERGSTEWHEPLIFG